MGTERIGSLRERAGQGLSSGTVSEPCGPVSGVQAATHRNGTATRACQYVAPSPPPPRVSHDTVETSRVHVQPRVDRRAWTRPRLQRVSRRAPRFGASKRRRLYHVLALAGVVALAAAGWVLWHRSVSSAGAPLVSTRAAAPTVNNDEPNGTRATSHLSVPPAKNPQTSPSHRGDGAARNRRVLTLSKSASVSGVSSPTPTREPSSPRPGRQRSASMGERSVWLE